MIRDEIKLIIFDFDQILVGCNGGKDDHGIPRECFNGLAPCDNLPLIIKPGTTNWVQYVEKLGIKPYERQKLSILSDRVLQWRMKEKLDRPYPWVFKKIPKIAKSQKVAIWTSNSFLSVQIHLGDVFDCFEAVETWETVLPDLKPSPAGGINILQKTGIDPKNAIYIGDSMEDRQAGIDAGIRTVIVGKDWHNESGMESILELIINQNLWNEIDNSINSSTL